MPDNSEQLILKVARVCHEANRAWCIANCDYSQLLWDHAPEWQMNSAVAGVRGVLEGNGPEQSHLGWLAQKEADGWVYGDVKDPAATPPTHPCMRPYDELPEEQKRKDHMFVAIVNALMLA
jgi:hypothetical protein